MTRICHAENQLEYLNKMYEWAFTERDQEDFENHDDSNQDFKNRPGTASTRTRPYSAVTKTRPNSGIPQKPSISSKKSIESEKISS